MPIRPCEIDTDSEDENDPDWLKQKTQHVSVFVRFQKQIVTSQNGSDLVQGC